MSRIQKHLANKEAYQLLCYLVNFLVKQVQERERERREREREMFFKFFVRFAFVYSESKQVSVNSPCT